MEEIITIKESKIAQIEEKKSKFIANIIPVESQEIAEKKIKEIKKEHYKARHNCVAYRIIENEQIVEKASDDGEPSGTAGGPMLNILQKNNLINVLVVVTRYFGGILLGTGGLVRAYSEATLKAIEEVEIVKKSLLRSIEVKLEYQDLKDFKYYCQKNNIKIDDINYTEKIVCKILVEEGKKEKFIEDFNDKKVKLEEIKILSKQYW